MMRSGKDLDGNNKDGQNQKENNEVAMPAATTKCHDSNLFNQSLNTELEIQEKSSDLFSDEAVKDFASSFLSSSKLIEERIQSINSLSATNLNFHDDIDGLFAEITVDLEDAQQYLIASSHLLAENKKKACQVLINNQRRRCTELQLRFKPQKMQTELATLQNDRKQNNNADCKSSIAMIDAMLSTTKPQKPSPIDLQMTSSLAKPMLPETTVSKPKPIIKPATPLSTRISSAFQLSGVFSPMTTRISSAKIPGIISKIPQRKSPTLTEPTTVVPSIRKITLAPPILLPINTTKTQFNQSRMPPRCRSPETERISFMENTRVYRSHYTNVYMRFRSDDIKHKEVSMKFINNSFIVLEGKLKYLHISDSEETVFLCGGVTGRVLVENCKNCSVVVVATQVNIRASMFCCMYLHVKKNTAMENCHHISFGEYDHYYHNCEDDFHDSSLSFSSNKYSDVIDFSPAKSNQSNSGTECTKNWSLISDASLPDWRFLKEKFKENFMERLNK